MFLTAYRETGGESSPNGGEGAAEEEHASQERRPYLPLRHDEIAQGPDEVREALGRT